MAIVRLAVMANVLATNNIKKDMATLKAEGLLKSEPYIYIRSNVNKIRRKMGKPDYAV